MTQTIRSSFVVVACLGCAAWAFSVNGNAQGRGGAAGDSRVPNPTLAQQPPQKGTALVLGQVVDATSGQPIAEATVNVQSRIPVASLATATSPTGPLRLITGPDGQFVLHDLPKTNLQISVTAPGYVNGTAGQSRPGGTARPVEIEDGQRLTDLKIKMWKYAVVTGTVIDDAGEPAVGIMVQAIRRSNTAGRQGGGFSGSAMTDDRGVYRLSTLTPGDYIVAIPQTTTTVPTAAMSAMLQSVQSMLPQGSDLQNFAASEMTSSRGGGMRVGSLLVNFSSGATPSLSADGRLFAYQSIFYPSATTAAQATLLTLKSGEERMGIDLQMKVIPTMGVSGKLMSPEGPAANISVRLQSIEAEQSGTDEGLLDSSTTTSEADGSFTFLGVPAGQYTVRATRPARSPSSIPAELANNPLVQMALGRGGGGPVALFAQAPVSVGSNDVTDVSLVLAPGPKVSGKIEFEGAAPQPTPQQLQQFSVSLTRVGAGAGDTGPGRVGQDGQFTTPGYAPGRYYVTPTGRGAGAWVVRSAMSGGRDVLSEPLELRDSDVTDVVVTYTDKISQVLGTVRAPGGAQSPPPTTLLLFPADYRSWMTRGMNPRFLRTQVVPKGGTFTMGNVVPADYLIAALEDADIPENQDLAFFEALARVATRVVVREGERPSVDLAIVKVRR